jgi:hypothetical protein
MAAIKDWLWVVSTVSAGVLVALAIAGGIVAWGVNTWYLSEEDL